MWKYVGKLEDQAYLWKHKTSGKWAVTLERNTRPCGNDGYYMLANLLIQEGI
jgi:hypothetical protein